MLRILWIYTVFITDLGSNLVPAGTALDVKQLTRARNKVETQSKTTKNNDGIGIFYVAVDQMLDWGMLNDGAGIFQVAVDQLLDWGTLNHGIGIFVVAADQLCLLQLEVNQCSAKVLPNFSLCGLVWSIRVHLAY